MNETERETCDFELSSALNEGVGEARLSLDFESRLLERAKAFAPRRKRVRASFVLLVLGIAACVSAPLPVLLKTFDRRDDRSVRTGPHGDNLNITFVSGVVDELDGQPALEMSFKLKDPSDPDANRRWFSSILPLAGGDWWRDAMALAFDVRCCAGNPMWTGVGLEDRQGRVWSLGTGWDGNKRRNPLLGWGRMPTGWTTYAMNFDDLRTDGGNGGAARTKLDPSDVRALRFSGGTFDQTIRIRNVRLVPKSGVRLVRPTVSEKTLDDCSGKGACGWTVAGCGGNMSVTVEGGVADETDGRKCLRMAFSLRDRSNVEASARWFSLARELAPDESWKSASALALDVRSVAGDASWTGLELVDRSGVVWTTPLGWNGVRMKNDRAPHGPMQREWTTTVLRFSDLSPDVHHPGATLDPRNLQSLRLTGGSFDQEIRIGAIRLLF